MNEWLKPILEELEKNQFHGKVVLNIHAGSIENIEKQERVNKPKIKDGFWDGEVNDPKGKIKAMEA